MEGSILLKGLIIGFAIAAPVGPIGVLCIRRTLAEGRLAGLLSGLGAATADAVYGCIAGFGLTVIAGLLISQQMWLSLIGGAFLFYLGVKNFLARPTPAEIITPQSTHLAGAYVSTFFLTLTNPATILSFTAIFASLGIAGTASNYLSAITLVLGVFLGSALWWLILSSGISLFRAKFTPARLRWVNKLAGIIIGGFGLAVLLSLLTGAPPQTHIQNTLAIRKVDLMKKPLITHIYTADPSAHVFEDRLYIYPSHDLDHDNPPTQEGDQFDMVDYHVFSLENMHSLPVDHGQVLHLDDVPWAEKQMWAPDAAFKNGAYYFYFPARDHEGIFRIGVALSQSPAGPFTPQPEFIPGSFSIDPCVFIDDDRQAYMYFGGLWGGQLEKWKTGQFDPQGVEPSGTEPALGPRVAKLSPDMLSFDGPVEEISITDEEGQPLLAGDHARRFFEAAWLHKYNGVYYFSYSTGDTHFIAYATGQRPTGPFVFRGYILNPVVGWTTHHSIVEFQGKWYLFYHDSSLSGGVSHKRSVKVAELIYNTDGSIHTIEP